MFLPPVGESSLLSLPIGTEEVGESVSTPCRGITFAEEGLCGVFGASAVVSTPCRGITFAEQQIRYCCDDYAMFLPPSGNHLC